MDRGLFCCCPGSISSDIFFLTVRSPSLIAGQEMVLLHSRVKFYIKNKYEYKETLKVTTWGKQKHFV